MRFRQQKVCTSDRLFRFVSRFYTTTYGRELRRCWVLRIPVGSRITNNVKQSNEKLREISSTLKSSYGVEPFRRKRFVFELFQTKRVVLQPYLTEIKRLCQIVHGTNGHFFLEFFHSLIRFDLDEYWENVTKKRNLLFIVTT